VPNLTDFVAIPFVVMEHFDMEFPVIPPPPPGYGSISWPASVLSAYRFIQVTLEKIWNLLELDNGDSARLQMLQGTLKTDISATRVKISREGSRE
jgi:hypothetical protein